MTVAFEALALAAGLCIAGLLLSGLVRVRAARGPAFALLACAGAAAVAAALLALRAPAGSPQLGEHVALRLGEHVALRLDGLSAFFVLVLGCVAAVAGLFACGRARGDERGLGLHASGSAAAILLAALIVCTADDVWFFLFGWEFLALAFAWAVAFAGNREGAERAAYFTLVVTHAAGAALLAALLLLTADGNTSVGAAATTFAGLQPAMTGGIFLLLLLGFGAKIGMLPLQGWMSYAYPAAPGPVAALMAAGALNVGFYGIERFVIATPVAVHVWWAILVLALGSAGAVGGIVWALAQRDIRRLAAYSSVENAGIILVAIGVALAGRAISLPLLTGFGLAAAAVQILAHAFAKATLFLVSSDVEDAAGTNSFELLGGLWKPLPVASAAAVAASLSLAALPPFGGFAGEWLSLEACMQAFRTASAPLELALALAGAAIGLAAGVAVVAFVKTAGVAFLGAPRSARAEHARGARLPSAALAYAALVLASLAVGSFTPVVLRLIAPAVDSVAGVPVVSAMIAHVPLIQPPFPGFSSTSGFALIATALAFALGFRVLVALVPRPAARRVAPWTSGGTYVAWTQYTGTGFVNASRVVLDFVGRIARVTRGHVEAPGALEYESYARPLGNAAQARAVVRPLLAVAKIVRKTQSGSIGAYLSYILVFIIALLMFYPVLRRW